MQAAQASEAHWPEGAVVDVSVEYAHIYADETFGPEQLRGIREMLRLAGGFRRAGRSYSLAVLVDDYNPDLKTLSVPGLVAALTGHGAAPDHVIMESALAPLAEAFLDRVSGRDGRGLRRYVRSHGKVPCALLLAAWHLVRLGALPTPCSSQNAPPLIGRESLTVLPLRFASVEARAFEIIRASPHAGVTGQIKHRYFGP